MHMTSVLDKELVSVVGARKLDDKSFIVDKQLLPLRLEKGKCYIIAIDNSSTAIDILETTRTNWNSGQYLKSKHLKCEVVSIQGSMAQVNACGYDPATSIDGNDIYLNFWINVNIVTILKSIS